MEVEAPDGPCVFCAEPLWIVQHRERFLQTLKRRMLLVCKDRACSRGEDCPGGKVLHRPVEEGRIAMVRKCSYSLEVIGHVGLRYLRDSVSLPNVHRELCEQYGVDISERHVGNLLKLFLAMVECRNADTQAVQERLREQGYLMVAIDAVKFDEVSPALYVLRDVPSREVLYSSRLDQRGAEDVKPLLERVKALEIPIIGVVSDKEPALVAAVEQVLPGVPHQLCQSHYLQNVAKPLQARLTELGQKVREATTEVRELEKSLDRRRAADETERKLVGELCKVVATVGKSSGDKLTNPTSLKRHQRLEEVARAAEEARRTRDGEWPLLARFLAALTAVTSSYSRALAEVLALQVGVIRHIAHILKMESSSRQVKRVLRAYLNQLERGVPPEERHSSWGPFVQHVRKVSDSFWKGLFHCYDEPRIPRTNNSLEQFFNVLKRHQRKVTGQKSTSGGPMETCAPFVLAVLSAIELQPELIQGILQDVPDEQLAEARRRLEELAEPARLRRSTQRDPTRRLQDILHEWRDASEQGAAEQAD